MKLIKHYKYLVFRFEKNLLKILMIITTKIINYKLLKKKYYQTYFIILGY